MLHLIRDIFIFLASVFGISWLYRQHVRRSGSLVRVVAFHDVANREWFERVIDMLAEEFHIVTPQEFYTKEFDRQQINLLLTFDDGYYSWIEHVLPVLEKHDLKGLFFINSGLLDAAEEGKTDEYMQEQLKIAPKQPLTWDGAEELVAKGHTIGGHTGQHDDLSALDYKQTLEVVQADKVRTELLLEVALEDFAYPFGTRAHYTADTIFAARESRYKRAYTAVPGFVTEIGYEIPRLLIEKGQSISSIKRWIKGGYDIFSRLKFNT